LGGGFWGGWDGFWDGWDRRSAVVGVPLLVLVMLGAIFVASEIALVAVVVIVAWAVLSGAGALLTVTSSRMSAAP
jgi:type IV secretory pathway VirB3-like protein